MSARLNCYASFYSWIVFISYADVKSGYELIKTLDEWDEAYNYTKSKMIRDMFKTVVFSSMAIESFLNDYLAQYLGDKLYKDSFDKLSPLNKLQLVGTFVFSEELEKGREPYQSVSLLFTKRNEFVHNKSEDLFDKMPKLLETVGSDSEEKNIFDDAKIAIKALCETAKYFESKDYESSAMAQLAWSRMVGTYDNEEAKKVQNVQYEMGIPLCVSL